MLCGILLTETTFMVDAGDLISIEIDSEAEHEENSQEEKEKNTLSDDPHSGKRLSIKDRLKPYMASTTHWITPSIDLHTPPPRLI